MLSSLSRRRVVVLLVLTSLLLITLGPQRQPGHRQGPSGVCRRSCGRSTSPPRPSPSRSPTPGTASPTTTISKPRTRRCATRSSTEGRRDRGPERRSTSTNELLKLQPLDIGAQLQERGGQVIGDAPSNFQNTVEITSAPRGRGGRHAGHRRRRPDRQGHQGLPRPQPRPADHRSAVLRRGAGASRIRRRSERIDVDIDATDDGDQRPAAGPDHHVDSHDDHHRGADRRRPRQQARRRATGTTTSTTTTTDQRSRCVRETGDVAGSGRRPAVAVRLIEARRRHQREGRRHRRHRRRHARAWRRRAFRSASSPRVAPQTGGSRRRSSRSTQRQPRPS